MNPYSPQAVPRPPITYGALIVALAFVLAPTQIWGVFELGGKGVTVAYLGAAVGIAWSAGRVHRIPTLAGLVVSVVGLLSVWGLVLSQVQSTGEIADRGIKHWILFAFSVLVFASGATARLDWRKMAPMLKPIAIGYLIVIGYGAYQAFARRYGWPFAFLSVTNPGLSAPGGLQPGALSPNTIVYDSRASSFFVEPTVFGTYLGYGAALSFSLLERGGRFGRWGLLGLVATGLGFAACQSLSATLSILVVVSVHAVKLAVTGRVRQVVVLAAVSSIAVGILLMLPGSLEAIQERLINLELSNSSHRFDAVPLVLAELSERPWGLGMAAHAELGDIQNGMSILLLNVGWAGLFLPLALIVGAAVGWRHSVVCSIRKDTQGSSAYTWAYLTLVMHVCVLGVYGTLYEPFYWTLSGAALGTVFGYTPRLRGGNASARSHSAAQRLSPI